MDRFNKVKLSLEMAAVQELGVDAVHASQSASAASGSSAQHGAMLLAAREDQRAVKRARPSPASPSGASSSGAAAAVDTAVNRAVAGAADEVMSSVDTAENVATAASAAPVSDDQKAVEQLECKRPADRCAHCQQTAIVEAVDEFFLASDAAYNHVVRYPCRIARLVASERSANDAHLASAITHLSSHALRELDLHDNDKVGAATMAALGTPAVARQLQFLDLGRCHNVTVPQMVSFFETYSRFCKSGARVALRGIRLPPCTDAEVLRALNTVKMMSRVIVCASLEVNDAALALFLSSQLVCEYVGLESLPNITGECLPELLEMKRLSRLKIKDCPEVNLAAVADVVQDLPNLNVLELVGFGNQPGYNFKVLKNRLLPYWDRNCMYSLTVDETIVPAHDKGALHDIFREFPLTHLDHKSYVGRMRDELQCELRLISVHQPFVKEVNRSQCHCTSGGVGNEIRRPKLGVVAVQRSSSRAVLATMSAAQGSVTMSAAQGSVTMSAAQGSVTMSAAQGSA